MKILLRLLREQATLSWLEALAIVSGCVMVGSGMVLLGVAAYLVVAASVASLWILLSLPVFLVRLAAVVRPLARYAERCLSHDLAFRVLARLRTRVYACLEPLAPALLLAYRSGDLLTRLTADIDELQTVYLRVISPVLVAALIACLLFVVLSLFSVLLAWFALTGFVLAGLVVPLLTWWLAREIGAERMAVRAEQQATLVDGIQGMQDLLAYDQFQPYLQKIASYDQRLGALQRRMAWIGGLQEMLQALLRQETLWCVLILAFPLIGSGRLDGIYPGALTLFILASFEATQPLGQACQFLDHALAAGRRLFALLDTRPTVVDSPEPLTLAISDDGYALAFEKVGFAYDSVTPVLEEITLHVRAGSRVALVGSSGAGKSTLLRLILRYWDSTSGYIALNDVDICRYALSDLRALCGVVTQDTFLFNTTLRNNLLLARSGCSDEQLWRVLDQAQLGEFARQLPGGLDTWLGEQGLRLSGGERQRLAIARALLKDAPILLLDEVTANLDPRTEQEVLRALYALMQNRTTLLVTHRLVMMEEMDEILVLEDGVIQERGTHAHLLAQQGRYTQLFAIQQSVLTFAGRTSEKE